jgi:hypothetical protein
MVIFRWTRLVLTMVTTKSACKFVLCKTEASRTFGRPRRIFEKNIKKDILKVAF